MRHKLAICALSLCVLAGCGKPAAKSEPAAPADAPKPAAVAMPQDMEDVGATDNLIKVAAPSQRSRDAYVPDPAFPKAILRGICRFEGIKGKTGALPTDKPFEIAVKDAEPGEASYYQNAKPMERANAALIDGVATPLNAVVKLVGVRAGREEALIRPVFNIKNGMPDSGMLFCGVGERIYAATWDAHPCHLRLASLAGGEALGESKVRAYVNTGQDPAKGGAGARLSMPESFLSSPVPVMGVYQMCCLRHPWQKSYVVATDNPYIVLAARGSFQMSNVPAGKLKIEVWHPEFEPVEKHIEVTVGQDDVKEVTILFKAPDYVKAAATR